jgi:16S rRNA processing protein RimM
VNEIEPNWVILGRISGLFGVRGWVKVYSETSPPGNILDYPIWHLGGAAGRRKYALAEGRVQGKGIVARLDGCSDRDQAAELVGAEIAVPREQLPEAGDGEFYWTDLEGLQVRNLQGIDLGRVDHLFETGANDVMVVQGDRQRLIPYTADAVQRVDLAEGWIIVDWDADF